MIRKYLDTLAGRLTVSFVLTVALLLLLSLFVAGVFFQRNLSLYLEESPVRIAEKIADEISPVMEQDATFKDLQSLIVSLSKRYGVQVILYDPVGRPIITSGVSQMTCDQPWCEGPMGGMGSRTVAVPVVSDQRIIGYVGVVMKRESSIIAATNNFRRSVFVSMISAGILLLVLSIIVSLVVTKKITKPILESIDAVKKISEGNYSIDISGVDSSEIGQLKQAVINLAGRLKSIEERRLELASDIAHEFKTPLTVIRANLEGIRDGVLPLEPGRIEKLLTEIENLSELVDQLKIIHDLDGARFQPKRERIDLGAFLSDMLEIYSPLAEAEGIEVYIDLSSSVIFADRNALRRIFENLFNNAVNYTESGGSITVRAFEKNQFACFEIEDTGEGISKEDLPLVFERFYRADASRSRKTGGSGLGLSIVKKLVEMLDGKIEIESEKGKGTLVRICFPVFGRD